MAHVFVLELHPLCGFVCVGAGFLQIRALGGDSQHAASVGNDLSVFVQLRPRMEKFPILFERFCRNKNGTRGIGESTESMAVRF